MLFGPQQRNWQQRIARTARRLYDEGLPEPDIRAQLAVVAAGLHISGHVAHATINQIIHNLPTQSPASSFVTPKKDGKRMAHSHISPEDRKPQRRMVLRGAEDEDMEQAVEVSNAFATAGSELATNHHSNAANPTRLNSLSASSSGGVGGKGSHETPIARQMPHYGIPETITAVLPGENYFSVICPVTNTQLTTNVQFRLTSTLDRMITSRTTPTASATFAAGVFDKVLPIRSSATGWPATLTAFPTLTTDLLQWRTWYHKMYTYYTVIGVEYTIDVVNAVNDFNRDVVMVSYIDTYSTNNATNIHPTGATLAEMKQWPDVKWKLIRSANAGYSEQTGIKGYYTPGQAKTNVENDEDIKTWTKVGSAPSLTEILTLGFSNGWMNDTSKGQVNVRIGWRYIVQFKDLNPAFRWPTSGQASISVTAPTDILVGTGTDTAP